MPRSAVSSLAVSKAGLFLLLLLLGSADPNNLASAIKCGTPLTTDCLGDTDIRYDPDASNNLVDQAVLWGKLEGLFVGGGEFRVNAFQPLVGPVPASPDPSVLIFSGSFFNFVNQTNIGSRRYFTSYSVNPLASEQVSFSIGFSTTSYEKDGTFVPYTWSVDEGLVNSSAIPLIPSERLTYPVDDNTMYQSNLVVSGEQVGVITTLRVCLDVKCDRYDESSNLYLLINDTATRIYASEQSFRRVATAEEWYQAIYDRYNESNIPLSARVDPTVDPCSEGFCPTEEQWCQMDPNCSESPYQEPPASVRGGVIAGFTIAGVVILVAVLYLVHRYLLARQAQRYRTVFAKRIADTIEVRGSMRGLPPDALVEEFNHIDTGVKDGKLSKEEMWEFISSGKAGEMDRKDFDALFVAIDLDGSGNIDFLEFCAFMGKCHDEYRAARVDRGSIVVRSSRRLEVAGTTARRLSAASTAFQKVQLEEENEGDMA